MICDWELGVGEALFCLPHAFSLPPGHKDTKDHKGHTFFIPKIKSLCALEPWWLKSGSEWVTIQFLEVNAVHDRMSLREVGHRTGE